MCEALTRESDARSFTITNWLPMGVSVLSVGSLALFLFSLMGKYFFLAELMSNFRGQFLILFAILVPSLLLARQRWLALVCLIAMAWSTIGVATVYVPLPQSPPGEKMIRVMSFNVLGDNEDYESVIERIGEADPDILTVLEYERDWEKALRRLDADYPYQICQPRWHGFGIAIFSKYPLVDSSVTMLTKNQTDNPCIVTHAQVDDRLIRLVAIHTVSPISRLRLRLRNQQISECAEIVQNESLSTLVMGDFNCVPWSTVLSDFLSQTNLRDSRQGFGYQASWSVARAGDGWLERIVRRLARIPIDHVFVSPQIHVHHRETLAAAGSDHSPVLIKVSVSHSTAAN